MAHFRGTVQGNRGGASRLGSPQSGLDTHCDGWSSGVTVHGQSRGEKPDQFHIHSTNGSGYGPSQGYIGTVIEGFFFMGRWPRFKGYRAHNNTGCPKCKRPIRTLDRVNDLCKSCFEELSKE